MGSYLDTASGSFRGLSGAFGRSVLPQWAGRWARLRFIVDDDGPPAARQASPTCSWRAEDGEARTRFYLNGAAAAAAADGSKRECAATDWLILFWLFCIVHTVSWSIRWVIFEPYYRHHHHRRTAALNNPKDMQNFSQSCAACLFHTVSAYFAYRILSTKAWLYKQDEWFQRSDDDSLAADLKFYYLLYAARYLSDIVSLCFEHRRSDTPAYALHHVVTVLIVLLSAQANYTQAGGVMMYFFDWADPFMLAAKAFKYLSSHTADFYQFASDRLFEIFAVAFVATRNIMFTYVVYVAVISEDTEKDDGRICYVLKALLMVLVLLMTYWLGLILQASAYQRFDNDGNIDDIREEEVIRRVTKRQKHKQS